MGSRLVEDASASGRRTIFSVSPSSRGEDSRVWSCAHRRGGGGALCRASVFIARVEGISYRGCDIKVDAIHGLDDTIIEPNTLHGKETV